MDKKTKKIVLYSLAVNLFIVGGLLAYFQFFGNKIVVEPPKTKIIVPSTEIKEGTVIKPGMLGIKEIDQRDYVGGAIVEKEKILDYKTLIRLKPGMQVHDFMLQSPEEQQAEGNIKVSINLKDISNTVANQVKINDYININVAVDEGGSYARNDNINLNEAVQVVLAKRKIIDLVNSNGVSRSRYDTENGEFKTQFIILDMPFEDYVRYKAARLQANRYGGNIELTLCDPTQAPLKETFLVADSLKTEAEKEAQNDIENGDVSTNRR